MVTALVRVYVIALLSMVHCNAQKDLYFSFMLSQSTDGVTSSIEQDTSGVATAVSIALETINNDSSILEGYRLMYGDILNSQCDRSASLDAFFTDITTRPPTKVFLLGCGCSIATAPVGEISQFWQIIQMAYASLTPVISDRTSFPNMYSMLPTALSYRNVIIGLMNTYDWHRLAVISQLENEFDELRESLAEISGLEVASVTFHSSVDVGELDLFGDLNPDNDETDDYRIYFLNMYEKHARRVICKAYRENNMIEYPRYIFIVPGTYHDNWWKYTDDIKCNATDMKQVLDRSLVIATYPVSTTNDTDVVLTYDEFLALYNMEIPSDEVPTFAAPFAYDALWAMAIAMNRSNEPLDQFDNRNNGSKITESFKRELNNLTFIGLTGPVSFNNNGTREQTSPRVLQYRLLNETSYEPVLIGVINGTGVINDTGTEPVLQYVEGESNTTVWPVIVPFDGRPRTENRGVFLGVFIYLYIFATAGVCLCIACAVVNFVLRNKKVIRLTSPNLNYLIIIGCFMMIISTYFYAYPEANYTVLYTFCVIRAYTQNVGYMLCFGTVCAKMGRVYFIFHNTSPNRKRKSIQDWHLLLVVLGLSSIDIIIATVSLIVDDYKPRPEPYTENPTDINEYGITINIQSLNCGSDRSIIWIGLLFVTKAIVQLIAVFFAFTTRKVKIKALNDAKTIAFIIYVTTGILTVLLITAIALSRFLNTDAGVFGSLLVIFACTILLMLFIPKWYNLYKDPEGKNIFEGNTQNTFGSTNAQGGGAGISEQELTKLVNRIEELEERLGRHEAVTPSQPRRRFLSSTGDLTRSTGTPPSGMQGLRAAMAARGQGRSMSYSPTPVDTTASLPPKLIQQYSPAPPSPLTTTNVNANNDSGMNSATNSTLHSTESGDSPPVKPPVISLTIEEDEENPVNNFLSTSQTPLTASTNF